MRDGRGIHLTATFDEVEAGAEKCAGCVDMCALLLGVDDRVLEKEKRSEQFEVLRPSLSGV